MRGGDVLRVHVARTFQSSSCSPLCLSRVPSPPQVVVRTTERQASGSQRVPRPPSRNRSRGGARRTRIAFDHTLGYPGEGPSGPPGQGLPRRLRVVTANANAASTLIEQVLPSAPKGAIILAQETRVPPGVLRGEAPADRFSLRARQAGYSAFGSTAYDTGRGGTGGGVAILWPPCADVAPGEVICDGRSVSVRWTTRALGDVLLVNLYGVSGGGVAGNRALWHKLARHLASCGKPFVVGGDFNLSPAEAAALAGELALPAVIVAGGSPTYFGVRESELDFFLVHRRLAAAVAPRAAVLHEVPMAPHRAVGLDLGPATAGDQHPVMVRPRAPPTAAVVGPTWQTDRHAEDCLRLRQQAAAVRAEVSAGHPGHTAVPDDDHQRRTDQLWETWLDLAGAELEAATGAPARLTRNWQFRRQPLGDACCLARPAGPRPRPSHAFAFMRGRLLDARAVVRRVRNANGPGRRVPEAAGRIDLQAIIGAALGGGRGARLCAELKAVPEASQEELHQLRRQWTTQLRACPAMLALPAGEADVALAGLDALVLRLAKLEEDVRPGEWRLSKTSWTAFATESLLGHGRAAHRISRVAEAPPPAAGTIGQQIQEAAGTWGKLWGTDRPPASFRGAVVPVGAPPGTTQLREAARTFPAHTSAPDGCSPRHFALLSDPALGALGELLGLAEVAGGYAKFLEELVIRLIPKRAGGFRPICLFRSVARLHFRVLAGTSREWEAKHAACPAFNNSPGRRIQDATWRVWVRNAIAASGYSAEVLLDLVKAFELVQRPLLWEAAQRAGYPLSTLRLSLAAYGWTRRLVGDYGVASEPLVASQGVAAGSAFATYELKLLLLGAVAAFATAHPEVPLSVHVDDFTMSYRHPERSTVIERAASSVAFLVGRLLDVGLKVSPDKTEIVASSDDLASDLRSRIAAAANEAGLPPVVPPRMPGKGGHLPRAVRKLGIDLWLHRPTPAEAAGATDAGKRPRRRRRRPPGVPKGVRTAVKHARLLAFARRLQRCRALFGKVRFRKVMHTGMLPAALYAAELTPFDEKEIRGLRAGVLVAEGFATPGLAHAAAWALLPARADPEFLARSAPILRFAQEVWLVSSARDARPGSAPADALTPRELVAAIGRLNEGAPLHGPLAVLASALQHFGLEMRSPTAVFRDGKAWADLGHCSPALLAKSLATLREDAAQRWAEAKHGGPVDLHAFRAVARKATASEARVMAHLLGGTTRTYARAQAHGAQCGDLCPVCGQTDTIMHRATECPAGGPALRVPAGCRLAASGVPLRPALAMAPPSNPIDVIGFLRYDSGGVRRFLERYETDPWPPSPEVFTDGSGLWAGTPVAIAAGAAVQAVPRDLWPAGSRADDVAVFRVAGRVLPDHAPATSYGGEILGLLVAGEYLAAPSGEPVVLVSDCLNAVRRAAACARGEWPPTDPWGGLYREATRALGGGGPVTRRWSVVKTRAHRTAAQAAADDDEDRWRGNDAADWTAGHTLATVFRVDKDARESAARVYKANRRILREVIARLLAVRAAAGVPQNAPRQVRAARLRAALALPPEARHAFRWSAERLRYRCEHCARLVRRLPPPSNACLRVHPALARVVAAARSGGHTVHLCAVQGPAAGLLAICSRCGAYGAERASLLGKACQGVFGARRRFLEAVSAGRHPVCRASRVERTWALADATVASLAASGAGAVPRPPPVGEVPPAPGEAGGNREVAAAVLDPAQSGPGDEDWPLDDLVGFFGDDALF